MSVRRWFSLIVCSSVIHLGLGFLPTCTKAQDFRSLSIPEEGLFKGIAPRYDSRVINGNYLQDARNIFFDETLEAVKRRGCSEYGDMGADPVRGLWSWYASNGTEYLFALAGASIGYTTNGTFTIATGTWSSADTSATPALSRMWFTNQTNALAYWDGSSFVGSTTAATGRYIVPWRNRLWLSGITGSRSRLDGSQHLDGGTWTVGSTDNSPTQIIVGGDDGYPVNCLGLHSDYLFVGKEKGIYINTGVDKSDFRILQVSPEIGCRHHRTFASSGQNSFWLSHRGVEQMKNLAISEKPISDPVKNIVDGIIANAANQKFWIQTTGADFGAGNLTASGTGAAISTTIYVGAITPSSYTAVDTSSTDFSAGTPFLVTTGSSAYITLTTTEPFTNAGFERGTTYYWSTTTVSAGLHNHVGFGVSGAAFYGTYYASMYCDYPYLDATDNAWFELVSSTGGKIYSWACTGSSSSITDLSSYLGSNFTSQFRVSDNACGEWKAETSTWTVQSQSHWIQHKCEVTTTLISGYRRYLFDVNALFPTSGTFTTQALNTTFSTPTLGPYSITMSSSSDATATFHIQSATSAYGVWSASVTVTPGEIPTVTRKQHMRSIYTFNTTVATKTATVYDTSFPATTTGYHISQCAYAGDKISGWETFNRTAETTGKATVSFAISTGTTCTSVTSTTAWTALTPGIAPTVAISTYFAIRTYFGPTSTTETVKVYDYEQDWLEGNSTQLPIGCVDLDGRYWLFYTTNPTGASYIDSALVYDMNNNWTQMSGVNALSCAQYNHRWYTGTSSATGKVYQQGVGFSDDGTAIDAYLVTKDYDLGCFSCWKKFLNLRLDLRNPSSTGATFKAEYMLNGNGTWRTLDSYPLNRDAAFMDGTLPFSVSSGQSAKYIRFRFSNAQVGQDFRFTRALLNYEIQPSRP